MEESDTYLMILDEAQLKQARKTVLILGEARFGPADESIKIQLNNITDLDRLERMILRALEAADWRDILDTP